MALVGQYFKPLGISAGADHEFPAGVGGIANSDTYLCSLGYCLELALRPGVQHSALQTELNLALVLPMAARTTVLAFLFRADSGLCALKIMQEISTQARTLSREIAFTIQSNPRRAPVEAIAAQRVLDTHFLVCALAAVATNILRLTQHAGRWVLGLGANDSAHTVFERLYRQLTPQCQSSSAWRLGGAHVQPPSGTHWASRE